MRNFFNAAFKNPVSISVIALFATLFIWWIWLHYILSNNPSNALLLWTGIYPLLSLFGAIFGFIASGRWGGTKTFIGRAIIAFSLGLLFQFIGQAIYEYYFHYLNIEMPYPSISDIGFLTSASFYIYGALMLVKVSRINLSLKLFKTNIHTIIIPLVILVISYFIFLQGYLFDWSNPLSIFLDFLYPLLESIPISITLLAFSLSQQRLGGAIKIPIIFFILALLFQYLADFLFVYQAYRNIIDMGGIDDFLYAVSYILMAFSLILLSIWPKILSD